MSYAEKIEDLIQTSMDEIIRRYEADRSYHFIDTKLDLMTGEDFSVNDAWYKQKNIIFCWIQGRAMEALAKHIIYFEEKKDKVHKFTCSLSFFFVLL